jgi:dehydrogenase/reductase SDR family member 7B
MGRKKDWIPYPTIETITTMKAFENEVIWITGASSGIGEALAIELAKFNCKLVLSARRKSELERVQKAAGLDDTNSLILPLDLAKYEDYSQETKTVIKKFGKIDRVIHNGGISQRSLARDTKIDVFRKIQDVNYLGAVSLTLATLPIFREQKKGQYVAVTSIVGKMGTPVRSGYAASKHAMHGFFDSLRAEEWESNINVLLVCPGYIKTQVSVNALVGDGKSQGIMDEAQAKGMPAEVCARKILKAMAKNKQEVIVSGARERFAVYLKRFFPLLLSRILRNAKVT